jgi:hypothetical protein
MNKMDEVPGAREHTFPGGCILAFLHLFKNSGFGETLAKTILANSRRLILAHLNSKNRIVGRPWQEAPGIAKPGMGWQH